MNVVDEPKLIVREDLDWKSIGESLTSLNLEEDNNVGLDVVDLNCSSIPVYIQQYWPIHFNKLVSLQPYNYLIINQ